MKAIDSSSMDESLDRAGDREAEDINNEQIQFARWHDLFSFTSKTHSVTLVLALIISVASGIIVPALALFFGKIFDYFTSFGGGQISGLDLKQDVSSYASYLVALGCASGLLNACFYMLWMIFGELQAKGAREKLFNGMIEKEMEWYDMRTAGINTHSSRLQSLVRELQTGTSQSLGCVVQYAVTTVAALGLALYYSWSLTLITLATMPAAAFILARISAQIILSVEAQRQELTKSSKMASTAISAINTVKSFNGQDFELWQYAMAIRKVASHYLGQARVQALQNGFLRFFILSIFVQGFWYGSHLVDTGQKNPGDILTCFWACLMAVQTAEAISTEYPYLLKGKAAGATIRASVIHMERGRRTIPMVGKKSPRRCDGEIEVRNVSFFYPMRPDEFALNNVTFYFSAGRTTFIVGESGSGKSTLGDLLLGFYSPVSGNILIDGHPIQTLDVNWIRNNVTLVQQRAVLFNETVFKNIAFGCKDHSKVRKEEVKRAIETALLQYTIDDLPQGLDTIVGECGNAISSGQQQRVVIARARLRDTPILILDEATSALDNTSKMIVVDAIRRWRQGKTTIIITHDMSQVQADDFTYVLEKGEIVQADYRRKLEETEQGPFTRNRLSIGKIPPNMKQRTPPLPDVRPSVAHTRTVPQGNFGWDDSEAVRAQHKRTVVQSVFVDRTRLPNSLRMPNSMPSPKFSPPQRPSRLSFSTFNQVVRNGRLTNPTKTPHIKDAEKMEMKSMPSDVMTAVLHQENFAQLKGRRNALSAFAAALLPKRKRKRNTTRTEDIIPLKSILMTVWPILTWKDRLILVLGFACAAIHAAATPTFAYFFAKLLGTFSLPSNSHSQRSQQARIWSLSVLGVAVVDAIATYFMHYLLEYCGQAWVNALRKDAFRRILDQPRSWFDAKENCPTGLIECLDRNAEEMRNLLGRFAAYVFVALIMTSMAILWSMILSWRLTLVGLTCAPFMYLMIHFFESISSRWETRTNTAGSVVNAVFAETFTNIRTVRAFSLESFFHKKYFHSTHHALRIGLRRSIYAGFFFGLRSSAIVFIGALIYYYGAVLASSHAYSIQTIFTVMTMLLFSLESAASIIGLIPQIASSRATATSLLRLAQLPFRSSHEHTGTLRLSHPGPITFKNLTFTYPTHPTHPILKNFTLTLPPGGHSIALVGASGSGKSTLTSLLLGLQPPTSGTITFNHHHPISTLHIPTLRSLIALVPQNPPLFPTTIAKNITYALPHTTTTATASIHAAARAAGIHDFITSLPLGYDTLIGAGGTGLSGGQATRIAIARAVVRRPKILVLDEPTRGLDWGNVRGIREMVAGLVREGVGVVVVTHDVGMMRGCGEVVVLREGKVWERGVFEELVGEGGELARLIGVEGAGDGGSGDYVGAAGMGGDGRVEGEGEGKRGGRVWDEADGRGAWG